jgi:hypothetical protein
MDGMAAPICTYLLPLRRNAVAGPEQQELRAYFDSLQGIGCEVLVVDGSPPEIFREHAKAWDGSCQHLAVDRRFGYLNDKVNGIHTGLERAITEKIILADDDIRYTPGLVHTIADLLDRFEAVRPQNFLQPLPWWAKMEAARMLINRATLRAADYPGTCAFRRASMQRAGHYDGDVLFDNEEIIRHFAAHGISLHYALDLFVPKRPPSFRKWMEQRPRQAYEDFGLRSKTALFFALLPLLTALPFLFPLGTVFICYAAMGATAIGGAWMGRARGKAARFFPLITCLFAPLWLLERTFSTYWALYWRITKGGYPFGERVLNRGIGRDWIRGGRIASRTLREQPD